jgi:phosphoribosylformimino-5-aminoimidazole carboxamide ribotide isomerase
MRILAVLDLLRGRAVHARGGDRRRYQPVQAIAGLAIDAGNPQAVARIYRERYDVTELYVADLDAIAGHASQDDVVSGLAAHGVVWLDGGMSSIAGARHACSLGVRRAIVGLETLHSWAALRDICAAVGGDGIAFSLDLRDGEPMARAMDSSRRSPEMIAGCAVESGVETIIVIDVKKVGTRAGLDLELVGRIRKAVPAVTLFAGGGVRGLDDLRRLADAGCDGALVATAIHDGTLDPAHVTAARALGRPQPRVTR